MRLVLYAIIGFIICCSGADTAAGPNKSDNGSAEGKPTSSETGGGTSANTTRDYEQRDDFECKVIQPTNNVDENMMFDYFKSMGIEDTTQFCTVRSVSSVTSQKYSIVTGDRIFSGIASSTGDASVFGVQSTH